MSVTAPQVRLAWLRQASRPAKRALVAASLGWMLDSFDVMLFALVLSAMMRDLHLSKEQAGLLGSVTLLAAAAGGVVFGYLADRYGRMRALMGSILMYAIFTAACGLAYNMWQLVLFRALLGFGVGGEWACGAALVSETWPAEHRGKVLGLVQSSWAIGYALAAIVAGVLLPWKGWRAVFFVGAVPALITLLLRRTTEEPEAWQKAHSEREGRKPAGHFRGIFAPGRRVVTVAVTLMNACTLFAWWGFNLWVPSFLSLSVREGGIGLSTHATSGLIVTMQVGMWLGYVSFGFMSDKFGRKPVYVMYLLVAATMLSIYGHMRSPLVLLCLGPVLAFFGTGYFSGFAAVTSELYETRIRATAQGLTYNLGRVASAVAPFTVGNLAHTRGFSVAFDVVAVSFLIAAALWTLIPETKSIYA